MKPFNAKHLCMFMTALVAAAITGCAGTRAHVPLDLTPRLLGEVQRSSSPAVGGAPRPTVALVLGGGGLRGFAHLGVLRALEEADIKPDSSWAHRRARLSVRLMPAG
jgi:NTE family protein